MCGRSNSDTGCKTPLRPVCRGVFLSAGLIKSHRCGILKQILRKGGGGNVHRTKQAAGAGKTGQDRYPAAARYFGARGGPDTATRTLLEKCAVPILAAATPRAVWLEADVDSLLEAGILQGGDVMKHLEGCPQALLLAVTLGPGVDAQIRRPGWGILLPPWRRTHWVPPWRSRRRMPPKPSCGSGPRGRKSTSRAASRRLRRLAHHGAAESSGSAGHRPAGGHLCAEHQPDDPPQERDGHSGPQ